MDGLIGNKSQDQVKEMISVGLVAVFVGYVALCSTYSMLGYRDD